MATPIQQPSFNLHLDGVRHDFQVLAFTGKEAISQPFRFDLELVSEHATPDLDSLLQRPAFLQFSPDGTGIHGLIDRIAQGDTSRRLTHYQLTLRPHLARLAHRTNQRIFQHRPVPEIIALILKEHGLPTDDVQFHLGTPCPPRDYCVQYDESDLHFIQRLCEEEGLHYHFCHSPTGHRLVFGDDQTVFPKLAAVTYRQDGDSLDHEAVITRFNVRLETRPTHTARRDYHFQKPNRVLGGEAGSDTPLHLEDYDYPGRFTDRERGTQLARRALERHRHDYRLARGHSDQAGLRSGHFLPLVDHPQSTWNDFWLLTEVHHEGRQPQVLEESGNPDRQDKTLRQGYRNRFRAIPWDTFFRPPLHHPKPRIAGSQTAVVTGPPGQEIHCDAHGRVKVQFHWDREGQRNDQSSGWLRVASGWAGQRYGSVSLPRVGMEVLVTFLEGDPDQPLVTGCLHHAEHLPPYDLPEHRTRSVFKTLSSPGGAGYNELRLEDRKGQEQIFIHAQRDWDQTIGHDQKLHVGHERHEQVMANSYTRFKAEEHCTVDADRKVEVRMNDHLTVGQTQHVRLGNAQLVEAGREIHLKSGDKLVIDAGMELTLKVGGSFIRLDHSGVTFGGPQIRGSTTGCSSIGTPATPLLPGPVQPADTDRPGQWLTPSQILALTEKRVPRCEQCEKEMAQANSTDQEA
ncbi:type VI secretion system tip protein TssI/VgrG [Pseudomonas sp. NPDC089734]|uniref:type VI secretion system Vgr family protein n=1 Tax=Pseudomonas sp. NPDC089734 TaxID=3364469 RepID=UPI0037F68B4E